MSSLERRIVSLYSLLNIHALPRVREIVRSGLPLELIDLFNRGLALGGGLLVGHSIHIFFILLLLLVLFQNLLSYP